jgi:hypothetical protein
MIRFEALKKINAGMGIYCSKHLSQTRVSPKGGQGPQSREKSAALAKD